MVKFLEARGFEVLATNLRLGRLELDIVAKHGTTVAVVEVRTRGSGAWTSALGSIDAAKRGRIRRAGERLWQRRFRDDQSVLRLRYDVAAVSFEHGDPEVEYIVAAF